MLTKFSLLIIALVSASALAQLSLPPPLAFVNADSVSFVGMSRKDPGSDPQTFTGDGVYYYLRVADQKSVENLVATSINLTFPDIGPAVFESWSNFHLVNKQPDLDLSFVAGDGCQKISFGSQGDGSTIKCKDWKKNTDGTWSQACSMGFGSYVVDISTYAALKANQLSFLSFKYDIGKDFEFVINGTFNSQSATAPSKDLFTPPPNCVPPPQGDAAALLQQMGSY